MSRPSVEDTRPTQQRDMAFPESDGTGCTPGMSKREYFAACALQGLMANMGEMQRLRNKKPLGDEDASADLAAEAVNAADMLIEALNAPELHWDGRGE